MGLKHHLPLMQVLKKLKHYERQIVIDHLDDKACLELKNSLHTVLTKKSKVPEAERAKLKRCLKQNHALFSKLLTPKTGKCSQKKTLARLGGNPLALILSSAIPLLLNLI